MVGLTQGEQSPVTCAACDPAALLVHRALHRGSVSPPHRDTIDEPHMKSVSPNMRDQVLSPGHP